MTRIRSRMTRFPRKCSLLVALLLFVSTADAMAQGLGRVLRSGQQAVTTRRAGGQQAPGAPASAPSVTGVYTGPVVGSSPLIPGWGWYVPQSYRGYHPSFYAPPVAIEPRLGLQYNYPYAWQMGITMPADASPLVTPSLGPFEGVVRSQERSLRLNSVAARSGVALLRKGRYRDAGLLLARAYRDSDDPINPLLLAEALFGLGKYQHAELVLRKALESDGALGVLPEDVAGHFPSAGAFQERLADLVKSGKHQLLSAYMSLFAADGSSGIAGLLALMKTDKQAGKLYRHYLDRVFGPEEEAGEAPAEGKAQ